MMYGDVENKIALLMAEESRYDAAAYEFVLNAVTFTTSQKGIKGHVTALELLKGMKKYARLQYGAVSHLLLYHWGIHSAADAGRIVYLLIGTQLLSASESDREEDFQVDFDFSAFPESSAELPVETPIIC